MLIASISFIIAFFLGRQIVFKKYLKLKNGAFFFYVFKIVFYPYFLIALIFFLVFTIFNLINKHNMFLTLLEFHDFLIFYRYVFFWSITSSIFGLFYSLMLRLYNKRKKFIITIPGAILFLLSAYKTIFSLPILFFETPLTPSPSFQCDGHAEEFRFYNFSPDTNFALQSKYYDLINFPKGMKFELTASVVNIYNSKSLDFKKTEENLNENYLLTFENKSLKDVEFDTSKTEALKNSEFWLEEPVTTSTFIFKRSLHQKKKKDFHHLIFLFSDKTQSSFKPSCESISKNHILTYNYFLKLYEPPEENNLISCSNYKSIYIKSISAKPWNETGAGLLEEELRQLFPNSSDGLLINTFPCERKIFHANGEILFSFIKPTDLVLIAPASVITLSNKKTREGTIILTAKKLTSLRIFPSSLNEYNYYNPELEWSIFTNQVYTTNDFLAKAIETNGFKGIYCLGKKEHILRSSFNSLFISSNQNYPNLNAYLNNKRLIIKASENSWSHVRVNEEELWPSWWKELPIEAKASVLFATFLTFIGWAFKKRKKILTFLLGL